MQKCLSVHIKRAQTAIKSIAFFLSIADNHGDSGFPVLTSKPELLAGIEALPQGRRRLELEQAMAGQILPLFEGRILSFDAKAAEVFGKVRAGAQAVGNTIAPPITLSL